MHLEIPGLLKDLVTARSRCDKFLEAVNERWPRTSIKYQNLTQNRLLSLVRMTKARPHNEGKEKPVRPSESLGPQGVPGLDRPVRPQGLPGPTESPKIPNDSVKTHTTKLRDRSLWRLITRFLYPEADLLTPKLQDAFHKEFNRFIADRCVAVSYFKEHPVQKSEFRERDAEEALFKTPADNMTVILANLYNLDIVLADDNERVFRPVSGRYLVVKRNTEWETDGTLVTSYSFRKSTNMKLLDDIQQLAMKSGKSIWKTGKGIRYVLKTKEEMITELGLGEN